MRNISFKSGGVFNYRRDRRLSLLRLTVTVDGLAYDSLDWGLGGIRIVGLLPRRRVEDRLMVAVAGERKGRQLGFETMAEIVRMDEESKETALRFEALTAEDFDILEALITGRRISE